MTSRRAAPGKRAVVGRMGEKRGDKEGSNIAPSLHRSHSHRPCITPPAGQSDDDADAAVPGVRICRRLCLVLHKQRRSPGRQMIQVDMEPLETDALPSTDGGRRSSSEALFLGIELCSRPPTAPASAEPKTLAAELCRPLALISAPPLLLPAFAALLGLPVAHADMDQQAALIEHHTALDCH